MTMSEQGPAPAANLDELLGLERLDDNLFRGQSRDIGTHRVYGGQVLGQAASAAQQTVDPERLIHSLHAYFLREGDHKAPVIYDVDRSRDGRSFASRRVRAIQHGRPIFTLEASFHRPEPGLTFQLRMPNVPGPEEGQDFFEAVARLDDAGPTRRMAQMRAIAATFDIRIVQDPVDDNIAIRYGWFRFNEPLREDPFLHRAALAYISDFGLLPTVVIPHGYAFPTTELQMASLDHAMWFHRDFRIDDWLLYEMRGVASAGARGFAAGAFYRPDGTLVSSCTQEGLMRPVGTETP